MKQIAATLGVSPGSVHLWTSDIEIDPAHAARNQARAREAFAETWRELHRQRRLGYQEEGRSRARLGDSLHQAGCLLYWAEGSKNRNTVQFCNSDVRMLAFFRRFLVECLEVKPEDILVRLHVYLNDSKTLDEIEAYWLESLKLPATCLRGHSINPRPTSSSGKKRNKLPFGVCTLYVNNTRVVQHIYGAIQEYVGFNEDQWLDGHEKSERRVSPAVAPAGPSGSAVGSLPGPRRRSARRRGRPR